MDDLEKIRQTYEEAAFREDLERYRKQAREKFNFILDCKGEEMENLFPEEFHSPLVRELLLLVLAYEGSRRKVNELHAKAAESMITDCHQQLQVIGFPFMEWFKS